MNKYMSEYIFGFEPIKYSDIVIPTDYAMVKREEIIRCKDCKYFDRESTGYPICRRRCWDLGFDYDYTDEDGFCAWGKKKLLTEETVDIFEALKD